MSSERTFCSPTRCTSSVDMARSRQAAAMAHRLRWRAPQPAKGHPTTGSGVGHLRPSSEDGGHGAVTSETVAFFDTPLPDMGAVAEAWGIDNWLPQR